MAESAITTAAAASQAATTEISTAAVKAATEHVVATSAAAAQQSLEFTFHGIQINTIALLIGLVLLGILYMFYQIQKSNKLDFADMITKDGRAVSLTKVLQLLGGVTATWIMIKLTLTNALSESLFGIYLTYVGAIEGYSKYVAAKYGYQETSIKDGGVGTATDGNGDDSHPDAQKILKDAVAQAADAEASARDAKVSVKNAAADLKTKD